MSYKLNHFKDKHIKGRKILWSLGEYAITDFIARSSNTEEKSIYVKMPDDYQLRIWDDYIHHSEDGYFKLIGFADNLEEAQAKVNRIITGATVFLISSTKNTCPNCGKVEHNIWDVSEYKWTSNHNSYSYGRLVREGCISIESGIEYIRFKPSSEYTNYCQDCKEFDPDKDELPF